MQFSIDVKAFLSVNVEAASLDDAIAEAKEFVEGLGPGDGYADGWNHTRKTEGTRRGLVVSHGSMDCEDEPYCEDEEGNELDPQEEAAAA